MDPQQTDAGDGRFIVKTTSDSHFSWLRTRLSLERTLMSWVRTAVSLIGFGFTNRAVLRAAGRHGRDRTRRAATGAALSRTGADRCRRFVAADLRLAIPLGHRLPAQRRVQGHLGPWQGAMHTPLYIVSIALIFIGLFAFFAVLTRSV
jgi:putative membrane protein